MKLSTQLFDLYAERSAEIQQRLLDFRRVSDADLFYEMCFCLLTPQSKAVHADAVVARLKERQFFNAGGEIVTLLSNPATYIRFHNVKAARLHYIRDNWEEIKSHIHRPAMSTHEQARAQRDLLATHVRGFGMKESSHFLRNVGVRGLAIVDRHLLTNLLACGVIDAIPTSMSTRRYREVEHAFEIFSMHVGIDMDELDILFWCNQTGHILK